MDMTLTKRRIADLRQELGLSQEELAELAHIGRRSIVRLESEELPVRYSTAKVLLDAFNALREERGLSKLAFGEIDWKIVGEP